MAALLARAGIRVHKANAGMPILTRARLALVEGGLRVDGSTIIGDPLYQAGADRGDLITRVGTVRIDTVGALERALDGKRPGDRIEVEWQGRGATHRAQVTLAENPILTATPEEVLAGGRLTDAQRAFRARWLGSRAGAPPR
jgi:S1-C subfamily serine protease